MLEDPLLYEINHDTSMVMQRFPEQNAQLHIGTAAYHAERELDTLMYNDSVIFRDRQLSGKYHIIADNGSGDQASLEYGDEISS